MEFSKTLLAVDKTLPAVACGSYNVACGCLRFSGRPVDSPDVVSSHMEYSSNKEALHNIVICVEIGQTDMQQSIDYEQI